MDAQTLPPDVTPKLEAAEPDAAQPGAGEKLTAYGRARRQRERRRKVIRGTIGVVVVLVFWQVMAVGYNLEQIYRLPSPLRARSSTR